MTGNRRIVAGSCITANEASDTLDQAYRVPRGTGIEPLVGSVGESDDNALVETINGLYKAEAIHRRGHGGRWKPSSSHAGGVGWVDDRLRLEPIGNIPLVEAEERYYARVAETAVAT